MKPNYRGALLARIFSFLLFAIGLSRPVLADSLFVVWEPNPEASVVGYMLYVGTAPGSYPTKRDVGSAMSYLLADPVAGQRYCFAVAAYVAGRLEGPKSAAVCGYSDAPPSLTNPGNQTSHVGEAVALELSASDPYGQSLTYSAAGLPNGLTLRASSGLITGSATTAGTYNVTAAASDGLLSDSKSFVWTVLGPLPDSIAPDVQITGPTAAATYSTSSRTLALTGTASDAVGVTRVTWSSDRGETGTAATAAEVATSQTIDWSVGSISLQEGQNVVRVTAYDAAGNASTDALTVIYTLPDSVAPTVTISGPTTAATYATSSESLVLSGTAADAVGVTEVTWTNDRGGSGSALGTTGWNVAGVRLQSGTNLIQVTARDAAGNKGTDVLTVTYMPAPLAVKTLTADRAAPQPAGTAITWTASASGGTLPYEYKWLVYDGARWTVLLDWAGQNTYTWKPTQPNIAYKVRVRVRTARSAAGESADDEITGRSVAFPIIPPPSTLQLTGLLSDKPAPQIVGAGITWTAAAAGGKAPYQYKWWQHDGVQWTVLRDWTSNNTYTWVPLKSGTYKIGVWVRESTSTVDGYPTEAASGSVDYAVVAPPPPPNAR